MGGRFSSRLQDLGFRPYSVGSSLNYGPFLGSIFLVRVLYYYFGDL